VLEFRCGRVGVVSVLQADACNTDTTSKLQYISNQKNMTNVVIQQKKFQAPDDGYVNVRNMLSTYEVK